MLEVEKTPNRTLEVLKFLVYKADRLSRSPPNRTLEVLKCTTMPTSAPPPTRPPNRTLEVLKEQRGRDVPSWDAS